MPWGDSSGPREDSALGTQIRRQVSDQGQCGWGPGSCFSATKTIFSPQMFATQAGKQGMNELILRQQIWDTGQAVNILAVKLAMETPPFLDCQHFVAWSLLGQSCV